MPDPFCLLPFIQPKSHTPQRQAVAEESARDFAAAGENWASVSFGFPAKDVDDDSQDQRHNYCHGHDWE